MFGEACQRGRVADLRPCAFLPHVVTTVCVGTLTRALGSAGQHLVAGMYAAADSRGGDLAHDHLAAGYEDQGLIFGGDRQVRHRLLCERTPRC